MRHRQDRIITYQDYEAETTDEAKLAFLVEAIEWYKGSKKCRQAHTAQSYFDGYNEHIMSMKPITFNIGKRTQSLEMTKIPSNIFKRLVTQMVSYTASEGIYLNEKPIDEALGRKANQKIVDLATAAMIGGVAYALCIDGINRIFEAREMFVLQDEWDSRIKLAVNFWEVRSQTEINKYFTVFEDDGLTSYKIDGSNTTIYKEKQAYSTNIFVDGLGENVISTNKPKVFPIFPLFVNNRQETELAPNIKSKIDNIDMITSANATLTQKSSRIIWTINNTYGGDAQVIADTIDQIERLGIAIGDTESRAEPTILDPKSTERLKTVTELENDVYKDFMALNMEQLTQGNLTATAIKTSAFMLELRANELYYYICDFLENVCFQLGIEVKSIKMDFKTITNDLERVQTVNLMRSDITRKKALQTYPYIEGDEVESILKDVEAEELTGSLEV